MSNLSNIGKNIQKIRKELKKTSADFAEVFNISLRTYQGYERDERSFPHDLLLEIVNKYNVNLDFVYSGEGSMFKNTINADELTSLPICGYIEASLGKGKDIFSEEVTEHFCIPRSLMKKIGASLTESCIINTSGSSMYPTIMGGQDQILVDLSKKEVFDGKIYVFRMENTLFAKRLQKLPKNRIKVISDNPEYESYIIDLTDESLDFDIIGRVMWISRIVE